MNTTCLNFLIAEATESDHFVLIDTSSYNPDLSYPLVYYDVFLPNYTTAKTLQINHNQLLIVNSTQLGITTFDNYIDLPDGDWTIKLWYATDPEICLGYKVKTYFRIVNTKNRILEKVQEGLEKCDCKEVDKWYRVLQDLEIAKYMAENLCDLDRAIIIYNQVKNQLSTCQIC